MGRLTGRQRLRLLTGHVRDLFSHYGPVPVATAVPTHLAGHDRRIVTDPDCDLFALQRLGHPGLRREVIQIAIVEVIQVAAERPSTGE